MNKLTRQITTLLQPKAALIAYQSDDTYSMNNYYLEVRSIDNEGVMGEGMPVTYDFMNTIASSFSEMNTGVPYGIIPSNLLFADSRKGNEKYVWYNPPQKRMMFFVEKLSIDNDLYNMPGVVYVVERNMLSIYAYKSNLPNLDTDLYKAPFFNVSIAKVCLGSSTIPHPQNPTYEEFMQYWEKRFWLTEFSHLGTEGNPTDSNLVIVTKAARNEDFNLKELIPLNLKLKKLLK